MIPKSSISTTRLSPLLSPTGTPQKSGVGGWPEINPSVLCISTSQSGRNGLKCGVMSRFESPFQVLALFVVASFISIGIIFLINAEQESRIRRSRKSKHATFILYTQFIVPTSKIHAFDDCHFHFKFYKVRLGRGWVYDTPPIGRVLTKCSL